MRNLFKLTLTLVLACSLQLLAYAENETLFIKIDGVKVYQQPGRANIQVGTLSAGTEVTITERYGKWANWVKIRLIKTNEEIGWVLEYDLVQKRSQIIKTTEKQKSKTTEKQKSSKNKKTSKTQLDPGEEAGLKLLALQNKGHITIQFEDIGCFILFEPKVWNGMLHKDKVAFMEIAMTFLRGANERGIKKIAFLNVWNMTTRDSLAKGNLIDGKIEIYK
jgi:hypothetical protein